MLFIGLLIILTASVKVSQFSKQIQLFLSYLPFEFFIEFCDYTSKWFFRRELDDSSGILSHVVYLWEIQYISRKKLLTTLYSEFDHSHYTALVHKSYCNKII